VLGNQIASGKEVVKEQLEIDGTEIEQGIIEIDTSGLKSGMYFAVVKSNTKVEKIKFIIQQ
ncbi:MAG TPA: T9SS type A sorting domain-containing protein, partial [Candidatus Kapabacteria bacterium]|nr:T9SS type A sorting domain-containing protein [Candidatus Kapabacteria bacterium]